ncbi:MAG: hypothetical protein ACI90V_006865, partial [Bacillariaceae sp.]
TDIQLCTVQYYVRMMNPRGLDLVTICESGPSSILS